MDEGARQLADVAAKLTTAALQFEVSTILHATQEDVFALITDFANLPLWMPLVSRVEIDNSNAVAPGQVGAVRIISPPVGRPALEVVRAFEPPWLLSYSASDESLRGMYTNHTGILICEMTGERHTRLRWATYAEPGRKLLPRFFGRLAFQYVVRKSIFNLEQRFNSHVANER